jgi:hypothetical protein
MTGAGGKPKRTSLVPQNEAYQAALDLIAAQQDEGYLTAAQAATLGAYIKARYEQGVENALRAEIADWLRDDLTRLLADAGIPLIAPQTNYLGLRQPARRARHLLRGR